MSDVSFSVDGRLFASAGRDRAVLLWETRFDEAFRQPLPGANVGNATSSPSNGASDTGTGIHRHRQRQQYQQRLNQQQQKQQKPKASKQQQQQQQRTARGAASLSAASNVTASRNAGVRDSRKDKPWRSGGEDALPSAATTRHGKAVRPVAFSPQRTTTTSNATASAHIGNGTSRVSAGDDVSPTVPAGTATNGHVVHSQSGVRDMLSGQPEIVDVAPALFHDANGRDGRRGAGGATTAPLEPLDMPFATASTLERILNQVDLLTQTVHIIENRLTMLENTQAPLAGQHQQQHQQQQHLYPQQNGDTGGWGAGYDVEVRPVYPGMRAPPGTAPQGEHAWHPPTASSQPASFPQQQQQQQPLQQQQQQQPLQQQQQPLRVGRVGRGAAANLEERFTRMGIDGGSNGGGLGPNVSHLFSRDTVPSQQQQQQVQGVFAATAKSSSTAAATAGAGLPRTTTTTTAAATTAATSANGVSGGAGGLTQGRRAKLGASLLSDRSTFDSQDRLLGNLSQRFRHEQQQQDEGQEGNAEQQQQQQQQQDERKGLWGNLYGDEHGAYRHLDAGSRFTGSNGDDDDDDDDDAGYGGYSGGHASGNVASALGGGLSGLDRLGLGVDFGAGTGIGDVSGDVSRAHAAGRQWHTTAAATGRGLGVADGSFGSPGLGGATGVGGMGSTVASPAGGVRERSGIPTLGGRVEQ